jgi:hypothetical protein
MIVSVNRFDVLTHGAAPLTAMQIMRVPPT